MSGAIQEPYQTIIDEVCESDRLYFEKDPKARSYVRARPGQVG